MNVTIALVLLPFALLYYPVDLPAGHWEILPHLPGFCTPTAPLGLEGPTHVEIICVNPTDRPAPVSGYVKFVWTPPPSPPPQLPPEPPLLAVAAAGAAAAAFSHVTTNHREAVLAALAPILARVKTARAKDPVRGEILKLVDTLGAATLSQIVKMTGKGWGAVQWHLYVLEREGKVRSVQIGPFKYYFTNPKLAAEVILSSVNPDSLAPEDREKLEFLAAGA